MKISDYILARLAHQGIDTAFCVYGGAISELMDAFTRQDKIKYVCPHHEQAASFAAEGYAKTKGLPGVAIGTSGPGGQNMVTGIANCYYDSTPAIFITGQVQSRLVNPPMSGFRQLGFQETPIADIVRSITKEAHQICSLTSLYSFPQAFEMMISECWNGRPGPVLIDLPIDIQKQEIDLAIFPKPLSPVFCDYSDAAENFLEALRSSKRPAILVGGGAYKARTSIELFVIQHDIPCFRTWNAFDVIPDNSPVYAGTVGTYGGPGRNFGIQNCDLLLCLGTRLSGRITGGMPETFAHGARKFIVDIDGVVQDQVKGEVIPTSCEKFIETLVSMDESHTERGDLKWFSKCQQWKWNYDPVKPGMLSGDFHHYGFMRKLSNLLSSNAVVVYDTGGNAIMMGHCFRSKRGQRIFSSNGNTPMGFSLCGAIGAYFAEPLRPIICIIGDGGMCMNIQELQTLINYKIPVKIFILNNHILGNTKSYQRVNHMAEVACGPDGYRPPNFQAIASAYGISYRSIERWDQVEPTVREALSFSGPFIVDAIHHDFCQYEPRISEWDVGIEDSFPFLPREEFRQQMIIDPLPGWENKK